MLVASNASIGTPNILNLNLECYIASIHVFITTNSGENVLASTVYYSLLYHMTGAMLINITYIVHNFCVLLFAAYNVMYQ